jgi:hypothetical protein
VKFATKFGEVVSREVSTSLQRSHSILLKDNMNLSPLFTWLHNLGVKTIEDVKSEKFKTFLQQIKFNCEVKFEVDEETPMLVFRNIVPLQGDFSRGVVEYLNMFYKAMYNAEEVYL